MSEWIKCADRLPTVGDYCGEFGNTVLIWSDKYKAGTLADQSDVKRYYMEGLVSYWMPVPEPPKEMPE